METLKRGKEPCELIYLARVAELAERWDEMVELISEGLLKPATEKSVEYDQRVVRDEEVRLLVTAFRGAVGSRRNAMARLGKHLPASSAMPTIYRELQTGVQAFASRALELGQAVLEQKSVAPRSRAQLQLMLGDHNRYLDRKEEAAKHYRLVSSDATLQPSDTLVLAAAAGLAAIEPDLRTASTLSLEAAHRATSSAAALTPTQMAQVLLLDTQGKRLADCLIDNKVPQPSAVTRNRDTATVC